MEFIALVRYLGLEEKIIGKGVNEGKKFWIVKLLVGSDMYEVLVFDNRNGIIEKLLQIKSFDERQMKFKVTQSRKGTNLDLLDIIAK